MEMEMDYHKRTRFFAFKALAQFCGYLLHPLVLFNPWAMKLGFDLLSSLYGRRAPRERRA